MLEPERKPIKPIGVRTAGFDELLKDHLFERREYERDTFLPEQKRDALVAAQDGEGRAIQFIVTLSRDREGGLMTSLQPTNGAIRALQEKAGLDISTLCFRSHADSIPKALNEVITKATQAGYIIDQAVAKAVGGAS